MYSPLLALCVGLAFGAQGALAHEFWISPEKYQIEPDEQLLAHLRVGQNFEGGAFSFIPDRFERFDVGLVDAVAALEGRIGDRPAVNVTANGEGLWTIVHETTDNVLTYREWEKFVGFVDAHDLGPQVQAHKDRGLPETGFRESYRRFSKALISVGTGTGSDTRQGLAVEIVAKANPYDLTDDFLPVQLWQYDAPRRNAQLEVFTRLDGDVVQTILRSDDQGRVDVPAPKGAEILLNFVVLAPREGDIEARIPVWHSDWASLTFSIPR